jgi:low temperature requirement protein LtrA
VRRRRADGAGQRASTLELFYDLVFVFATTQVSHLLIEHLTWAGVLQSLIALLAVYLKC